jgi:hypothetical protein
VELREVVGVGHAPQRPRGPGGSLELRHPRYPVEEPVLLFACLLYHLIEEGRIGVRPAPCFGLVSSAMGPNAGPSLGPVGRASAARGLSRSGDQRARSARCEACGQCLGPSEPYRAVLKDRLGPQPSIGLARTRHRRHRRPISEPMPFPRIPQGVTISVMPRRLGRVK